MSRRIMDAPDWLSTSIDDIAIATFSLSSRSEAAFVINAHARFLALSDSSIKFPGER